METTEKTRQENKAISRKFWEYFEKGERDKIENELWAKNYKLHFTGQKPLNIEESKENIMKMFNTGFPDLKIIVEEQIAERDLVVDRFTAQGTHKGEFRGVAPTNKNVKFTGIVINRFADGKIIERWTEIDLLGIMTQFGVSTKITQVERQELAQ
jgi:predicted ester cyclase